MCHFFMAEPVIVFYTDTEKTRWKFDWISLLKRAWKVYSLNNLSEIWTKKLCKENNFVASIILFVI
jgi:hypothetical protein